jgi:predicted DNA-binding transcriptional regulator AlpA
MSKFLTVPEVAERYRTTESSIYAWIYKRTGPPSIKVGKRRLFALVDLERWEKDRAAEPDAA